MNLDTGQYAVLRRKMAAAFAGVALVPLFLLGGVILREFHHAYRDRMHAHLQEVVQKHSQNIDAFLTGQLRILQYVAASHDFETLQDGAVLTRELSRLQAQFDGVFEDMGVVAASGVQMAYAGSMELLKADYSQAEWFQMALHRETYISDVFLGLRGRPHFIVAVRGEGPGGETRILRATIDFRAFNTLVENLRIGRTGMAYILNREDEFQTRPGETVPVQRAIYATLADGAAARDVPVCILEDVEDSSGKYIFAGAPLKGGEWLLVFQQRRADAYRDFNVAAGITALILMAGAGAIVAVAWGISRRLARQAAAADREVDLMNRQVVETGKLAAIGELAAGIAHEINNPVAIMMEKAGWMQDLLAEEAPGALKNHDEFGLSIEEIRRQARRCKEFTSNLLNLARKTDAAARPLQVNPLLGDMVAFSRQRAEHAGVVFLERLQEDLPEVTASPGELQQVFLNLINNALDAMEKSGGEIRIVSAEDGGDVTVAVIDSGPGIPEADRDHLFEPFFTTKPAGKGTGLGLSICHGIITRMGGRIDVESDVGQGTTFRVRIPTGREAGP